MSIPWGRSGNRGRAWLLVPIALGLFLLLAVVLSSFQQELGLAEPGPSGRAAVAAAAAVDQALSGEVTYDEFTTALRVAVVAHRNMVAGNPADIELDHLLDRILARYETARVAWQLELEGEWDPAIHGDPEYWRTTHPGLEPPGSVPLESTDVRQGVRLQAAALLAEAVDGVED